MLRKKHLIFALIISCGQRPASSPSGPSEDTSWRALLSADAWVPSSHDPFIAHRPSSIDCDPGAVQEELGGTEINTALCNYISLEQPLLRAAQRGDEIRVLLWWQTLASEAPAEGHLALWLDDRALFETYVAVPGPADIVEVLLEVHQTIPQGTPLILHLHNHGYNTWNLADVSVRSSREEHAH